MFLSRSKQWIVSVALLMAMGTGLKAQEKPFLVVDPKGHNAIVNEVLYSDLTHEIISLGEDKTIRFWDVQDKILTRTMRPYSAQSGPEGMLYAGALNATGEVLAVAGYSKENDIKLISIQSGEVRQRLIKHSNVVNDLEFSPDGSMIASASSDESVIIWKSNGGQYVFHKSLYQHQGRVNDLVFSPDGKRLVSVSDDETIKIWNVDDLDAEPITVKNHLAGVKKVDGNAVGFVTGGGAGILNLWTWEGSLVKPVAQFDGPVTAINFNRNGNQVMVSADRQVTFDVNRPSVLDPLFSRNRNVTSGYYLSDNELVVGQGRGGNLVGIIDDEPAYVLRGQAMSFSNLFIKDGRLGFANRPSKVPDFYFDLNKEQIIRDRSELNGFKGAKDSDGTFEFSQPSSNQLLFGSSFQVNNTSNDGNVLSYTLLNDRRVVVGSDRTLKVYSGNGQLIKTLSGHNGQVLSMVAGEQFFYTYGGDQIVKVWDAITLNLKYNLLITRKYDWIIWDEQGYYNASAGGEQFLGWQTNSDYDHLSRFHDVSTYGDSFLATSLLNEGETARDQPQALPSKPIVKWVDPIDYQTTSQTREIRIRAEVISPEPIKKVKVLVEGKAMPSKRGVGEIKTIDELIQLNSYKTEVQIFAMTESSKVISEKRVFINPSLEGSKGSGLQVIDADSKPSLYFVGVGVSNFQNEKFNLTYADDDAESLHSIFTSSTSPVYKDVEGYNLMNEEATKSNILGTLMEVAAKVKPEDQVVLFIASHGINQDGLYYVLPHDANEQDLTGTCVNWNEIAEILAQMPCRVLLFLDTCHSGALGASLMSNDNYVKNTEALRKMGSNEVGVVIMSGSTGEESSLESSEWAHGVFTLSLIQGLRDKEADLKGDGIIYLRELDLYVADKVNELTGGKQNPTTQKPSTISKLIIY